jgi:hypothetical protein
LGDQRNNEESNCKSGEGMGQMAQTCMFMMMLMMSTFTCYFKRAFPLKAIYVKDHDVNKCNAQDLKVSR